MRRPADGRCADGDWLAVTGLGLRLAGVTRPEALGRRFGAAEPPPPVRHRYDAPGTDLAPVEWRVTAPVEPDLPASVPARGLRALPHESRLALAAAVSAEEQTTRPVRGQAAIPAGRQADGPPPAPPGAGPEATAIASGPAAVLWASSTSGLAEYGTVCVEAATLEPGLCNPTLGPASSFNGPAATVSIRLGLDGPNETVTGGPTAGLSALVEAGRLVADGAAVRALVGGSATVSRWSLAAHSGHLVAAEGAGCLAVRPWRDVEPGVRLGRFHRTGLAAGDLVNQARDLVRGAVVPDGPVPGPLVVSTPDVELVEALAKDHPQPVWHLERVLGDFGAAGGLIAVTCAVAHCLNSPSPTALLVLAVEPCGNAAIMEVSSWGASTLSSGCSADNSHSDGASGRRTSTRAVS
ncbi:beta-ketoacyl synthase N-terminal-like domain-containing protein [Plantactinospora sp. B5E13]|uniref:beta-ketoacyl synthase N-terminal-like domain-containing protein n=1 Tax=Plantactinospora sp. B5E13 TaxID=3153758 RepID=UPI00325DBF24